MGQGTNAHVYSEGKKEKLVEDIAQKLLGLAYEGILKSAFGEDRHIIVLTLIGGGAFGNDINWIVTAIKVQIPFIVASGMKVWLNIFDRSVVDCVIGDLATMVGVTNGQFVSTDSGLYTEAQMIEDKALVDTDVKNRLEKEISALGVLETIGCEQDSGPLVEALNLLKIKLLGLAKALKVRE